MVTIIVKVFYCIRFASWFLNILTLIQLGMDHYAFFVNPATFKIKPIFWFLENFQNILLSWKWRDLRKNLFSWTGFEVCRYSLFINEIFLSKHSEVSISKLGPRLHSYSALSRASGSWTIELETSQLPLLLFSNIEEPLPRRISVWSPTKVSYRHIRSSCSLLGTLPKGFKVWLGHTQ